MRKDEDCACINILQFRTTLSLQKHYISWTQKRKPGHFIQKFGTQILKIVYIAKYLHAFFCQLRHAKAVLFTQLQQAGKLPNSVFCLSFQFLHQYDRTKPNIICSDLHQKPLISGIFTNIEGKHVAIGTNLFPLTYPLSLHPIFKRNNR